MAKKQKYDADSIQRYAGLSGIRKRPTPYIGPTDADGLWTVIREPLDNGVDRALAGQNDFIQLIMDPEPGVYWVVDHGPGIPVGVKSFTNEHGQKEKLNTLYVATGLTHGGSNFTAEVISRGTHGLGIKSSNAMCKQFQVWTFRDDKWWSIEYTDAVLSKDVFKTKAPKLPYGTKVSGGTVVRLQPDLSLFQKGTKLRAEDLLQWAELNSYLVPNLKVTLTDRKGKSRAFKTKGPADYITAQLEKTGATQSGKSFVFSTPEADVAIAFTDLEGSCVNSYTNGLLNKEGGVHFDALVKALVKSLKPYQGKNKYTEADLKDGLMGLVNFKIAAPKFNNQPKDKLVDERVMPVALPLFEQHWTEFWTKNKGMAKEIVARATLLRSKTTDFLKDKKLVKKVAGAKKRIETKLAGVVGSAPTEKRELFLVEGDSAGGGCVRARDRSYQAIYPLKGKPLNVMSAQKDKITKNAEVIGLLAALGVDLKSTGGGATIQYGKVISLADADVDGGHITSLIMGILYKYMPSLFKEGKVYAVKSPLYKGRHKGKVYFGQTQEDVWKAAGAKCDITYLKGWGELSPEDLGVALDPKTRTLYRVMPTTKDGRTNFELLLGNKPDFRKKLFGVE